MSYNPGQPRGFGPHQPSITIPPTPYQQPPVAASPSGPTNNPCYNCGSIAHWAQHCPEPRRQVPAGSLIQRPRVPTANKIPPKKPSKPVITRYAPPPGYQPPVGGAPPPPPPPPPPQQAGPYQPQPYAAPVYGQQGSPVTPHPQWQSSPQTYAAPAPQWQQQPPVPAYGPHQPQAPQPYGGYGPHSPYPTATPTQQSPAQPYPPQPTYPVPHAQAHGPQAHGQPHAQQHPQHVAPYPYPHMHQGHTPVQSPQTGYPPPHAQPPYPITTQYPQAVPHVAPYQAPQQPHAPNPTFQPYVPPPQTNFRGHQQGGPSGGPHQRQHGNFARQNAHNHHHNTGDRSTHGGHNKNERRPKKFQQPQQAEPPLPRPPSPPQFFPKAAPTSTKNKNGPLAWKPAQPVDRPLEPINDGSKPKVSEDGADGTSPAGSKYLDAGGKAVKPEETQEMKDDPVWNSIKQEGTRLDMDGYEHAMDEDTEKLVTEMKTNLIAEEKLASRAQAPAKSGDASGNQKSGNNDGKNKRNWDEYIVTDKPSQDQDRRPNKRRHGNNRNQRGNRNNRHGNKQGGNRGGGHGGNAGAGAGGGPNGNAPAQSNQQGNSSAPQAPPVQRSFHPLPPKPVLGPPIQHSGDIRSANSSYPRPQGASVRRSTSPDRGQQHELNYRQRDYSSRIKTEDGGVRIRSEDGVDAGHPKKIPENADVRRHGSAAMEAYSRRW